MTDTTLTITGLQAEMTSDEVKQKLAKLYNLPEEKFEGLCKSLLVKNEPYVLIKKVAQKEANTHKARLTELGFVCGPAEEMEEVGGLSLAPVAKAKAVDAICPACEQPAGDGEMCEQCGVVMHKFMEQKKSDEKLQSQLKASAYSQERMRASREEKSERDKQIEAGKKRQAIADKSKKDSSAKQSTNETTRAAAANTEITVDADEKTSKKLYAAIASFCLVVVSAGVVAYHLVGEPAKEDPNLLSNGSENSASSATTIVGSANQGSSESLQFLEFDENFPKTIFDEQLSYKAELGNIKKKIKTLHEEDMKFSIAHLISSKIDPRERIFANQALVKLDEFNESTVETLQTSSNLISGLERESDQVEALLNQSDVYSHFNLDEEAAELFNQANGIASTVESAEYRILADVSIAEHQVKKGSLFDAKKRFQLAKDKASELDSALADSAYSYIAAAELNHGFKKEAKLTGDMISDAAIRERLNRQTSSIASKNLSLDEPEQAAALEEGSTGDALIDDLIEMTKKNQETYKAVGSLVGQ